MDQKGINKMSPLTRFKISQLLYKHFIRELIITKIKTDKSYINILNFIDYIIFNDDRKDGDTWDYSQV
jgi:hypothetical protein